jgi:phosphohistidine phosphatase
LAARHGKQRFMRRLFLLRHAKSAWPDGVADFDRPLAPRGIAAARLVGDYLRRQGFSPARVLLSPARRTRETWQLVHEDWQPAGVAVAEEARIYAASLGTLLAVVRDTPAEVPSLMMVGHNPAFAELALLLSKPDAGVHEDHARMARRYPTAGLAVIDFALDDWRVVPETGQLERFVTPKLLGGHDED